MTNQDSAIAENLWGKVHELETEHENKRADAVEALRELFETKDFWKSGGPLEKKYGNWPRYVKDRFGYSKTYAYALLQFDDTVHKCIEQGLPAPTHESQTRPITVAVNAAKRRGQTLKPVDIWADVLNMTEAEPSEITAKTVENVLAETGRAGGRSAKAPPVELKEIQDLIGKLYRSGALQKMSGEQFAKKYRNKLDAERVAWVMDWLREFLETG